MKRWLFLLALLLLILLLLAPPVLAGHKPGHQIPPGCQKPPAESSPGCQKHLTGVHYPPGCQKPPANTSPGCQKHQPTSLSRPTSGDEAEGTVTLGMLTLGGLGVATAAWLIQRRRRFASLKA